MKQAIQEWFDARTRIIKSIRKMNYRIRKLSKKYDWQKFRYLYQKNEVIKDLRRMDRILRQIMEKK